MTKIKLWLLLAQGLYTKLTMPDTMPNTMSVKEFCGWLTSREQKFTCVARTAHVVSVLCIPLNLCLGVLWQALKDAPIIPVVASLNVYFVVLSICANVLVIWASRHQRRYHWFTKTMERATENTLNEVMLTGLTVKGVTDNLDELWREHMIERGKAVFRKRSKSDTIGNIALGPPRFLEYLVYFFLPRGIRDSLLNCLEEDYERVFERFGQRAAYIWYAKEVFASVWPLLRNWILKLGVFGSVGEFIRRWIQ